jgi:acyl-[acyl-carrier-protein]-phospholipid O-acyltransferase/long-chain-fatty-acid--[acyl-carrier-protein] ligase
MSLGAFNDNFLRQALIALLSYGALELSASDKSFYGSMATGLMVLPFFLFSALAGELTDRYRKSQIVKINKTFELLVMVLAGVFFMAQSLIGLLAIVFLMGAQTAFFGPVKYGILPELVESDELMAGNGLFSGATFLAIVLGTMLGSYLVTVPDGTKIVMPVCLAAVGVLTLIFAYQQPRSKLVNPEIKIDPWLWRSTGKILRDAKSHKGIWLAILAIGWFWGMGSILLAQMPVLANTVMGAKAEVNAALVTMFAVGIAVGSLIVNKLTKGKVSVSLVPASSAVLTVLMVLFAYAIHSLPAAPENSYGLREFFSSPHHLAISALCLLIAMVGGVFVVPLTAYLQDEAEPQKRARVIAANNIMTSVFMVLGNAIVMVMIKMDFSIAGVFVFVGITSFFVTAMTVYFLTAQAFRHLLKIVLAIFFRPTVKGLENLDPVMEGPAIVICNHQSFADVALLVAYIPRNLTFAIDVYRAQAWWVRFFLKFYKTVPVNPSQPIGARELLSALDRGEMLVIFPEGRLNDTGSIMKVYDGTALVAARARCDVVTVILEDMEYTRFGRLGKLRRHGPKKLNIKMTVFPPVNLADSVGFTENRQEYRHKVSDFIFDQLIEGRSRCQNLDINLFAALKMAAKRYGPNRPMIEDVSRKIMTYKDLIRASKVLGKHVSKMPQAGTNVGVLLPNMNVLAVLVYGLWAAGKIPVMLNYSQGPRNVRLALESANAKVVFTSRKFIESGRLENLLEGLTAQVIFLEDLRLSFFDKLSGLLWRPKLKAPDSPAVILFTSGSEGVPKGVVLSHKNMYSDTIQAKTIVEINEDDVFFNPMPAFHAYGLNVGLVLPIILGLKLFLQVSPLQIKAIPELIYDTKATVIIASDNFAAAWGNAAHPYDFHRVRFIIVGAEKLKESTLDLYAKKFGLRVFEGYGVTEGAPILAVNNHMRYRYGSVGHIIPQLEHKLEPLEGLSRGGRLLVKGPNVMLGYLKDDKSGQVEPRGDEWYDTGDIGDIDADGYLWIIGRHRRFAKLSGEMISLASIEEVVNKLWPDRPMAVLSMPDPAKGERLVLVHQEPQADLSELRKALLNLGYSDLSCPKVSVTVPQIPLTPLGKVNVIALTEMVKELTAPNGKNT